MDNRTLILEACIAVFNKKGIKFTMDDLAAELSMSKKTIYTVFDDKEALFLAMVDYCFDGIKEAEHKVMENESMSTVDKIRSILGVMPDCYKTLDFSQLYVIKDKYPSVYAKMNMRLESGWEGTMSLIEKGISEGVIRNIHPVVLKTIYESSLETFLKSDTLQKSGIKYQKAFEETVEILMEGILA